MLASQLKTRTYVAAERTPTDLAWTSKKQSLSTKPSPTIHQPTEPARLPENAGIGISIGRRATSRGVRTELELSFSEWRVSMTARSRLINSVTSRKRLELGPKSWTVLMLAVITSLSTSSAVLWSRCVEKNLNKQNRAFLIQILWCPVIQLGYDGKNGRTSGEKSCCCFYFHLSIFSFMMVSWWGTVSFVKCCVVSKLWNNFSIIDNLKKNNASTELLCVRSAGYKGYVWLIDKLVNWLNDDCCVLLARW